jgi:hypothetical protein
MTRKEECLQDMLNFRLSWSQLKRKYSNSTLYDSTKEFEKNKSTEYQNLYIKYHELLDKAKKEESKVNLREDQVKKLDKTVATKQLKLDSTEQTLLNTQEQVKKAEEILNTTRKQQNAIIEKGIDPMLVNPILNADVKRSHELVKRVSTANKFAEVQKDLLATEQELEKMQKKKEKERKELAQIKDEKRSKANELDELKSKYLLWLAAIQVLVDSYKLGFTLNIVKGIIEELHKLSIKAQPIRSAHRVLERMRKVTTEIELDKAITAKKTQLSTLEKEYISLMTSIKTLKKDVIGTFSKVEKKAVNSIESISQTGKESLSGLITSVKQVEAQSINSIRCVNDEAEKSLTKHQTDVGYFFINNSNAVQLAIDLFGNQISEYCDLREEIGEMKPWIDLATILFGTYQDPKQLRRVNLNVLLKLTEGIHLYTVTRWPYERVKVPGDVSDRDFGILTGSELNLTSLSTLLLEGLRTLKWKGEV